MKLPKAVRDAMKELRDIADVMTIRDDRGRVKLNGYPTPGEVEKRMLRVYYRGERAGVKAMVKATEWTPAVNDVRAEIRRREKESRSGEVTLL